MEDKAELKRKRNIEAVKRYQKRNREKVLVTQRKYRKKCHDDWLELVVSLGLNKCSKCGYDKYFDVIDFHHVDPSTKECRISYLFYRPFTEKHISVFMTEINKCIPLCANCHRELHYELKIGGTNGRQKK